ncbi:MAG: tRNA (adenosine(37)-N6)-threonylcarbamoyltransferase complex dimerization subunit type 1 TsaB [Terrisporobacter sp.]|uniref:tRNA (adenosine(37)-N6)-threonylcarbamoyltransferase complex dimerization subunit type 1 TsaB n=1 Tax=Terrisporobacter sp. TaxID=1965305 RepID=UPI00399695E3
MKILGIDTSTMAANVAVLEDDKLICEYTINTKKTHSQKLMPMIENMLKLSDLDIKEIDAIAICVGPGSFTGLRIGMATAKAMAHVNNIPLIGVNSLEILGANMDLCNRNICSILDAQRNQVYMNKYILKDDKITELEEISIKPIDELLEEISSSNEDWVLVGEAVYKYKEKIEEISNITIPSPANNITKASTLCFVARDKMLSNDQVYNCYNINPMYIRKSQAEEQYEEKQKRLKDGK